MQSPVRVEVTSLSIGNGVKRDARKCALALAILDSTACRFVSVGRAFATVDNRLYRIPKEAESWGIAFDRGENVAPMGFFLTPHEVK